MSELVTISVDQKPIRPIGSMARLDDLTVLVISVQIQSGPRVAYNVAWTLDARRDEAWVEAMELSDHE